MAESTFQKHDRFVRMALTIGLVTVFVTVPVNAQQIADTSGLYGNVRDTSDAVIAGAQVEAKNLATGHNPKWRLRDNQLTSRQLCSHRARARVQDSHARGNRTARGPEGYGKRGIGSGFGQ